MTPEQPAPVEHFDLNAHEEKPPEQFDLAPQSNSIYSVPEILKDKSQKFAFGVDAQSEDIRKQLETGGEHYLREAYAAQESLNRRQLRNQLLVDIAAQKKGELTSDDLAEFESLVNLDTNVDPKTVLEEAYGKKFSNLSFQSAKDITVHKSTLDTVPDLALDGLDAVGSAVARREVASEVLQNLALEHQRSADSLTVGKFFGDLGYSILDPRFNFYQNAGRLPIDYLKMMLPAYANVKLGGWRWSTGEALTEEYQNLSLLPPSEFRAEFEKRVQDLAQENLPLALQWASGYLQYSNSDAALDNTFGYADWVGTGALALFSTSKLVRPVTRRLPSIRATPPKAPGDVPEAASSASVRVEPVTSEEQLEHIKDFRKALADTVKAANASTPEESLAQLGDIDAAAEIATHKRLVAEFEGKDPFDDGVALRTKLQGVFSPHVFGDDTGNLTAGKQARILGHLTRSSNNALRMLNTPSGVVRMTPDQTAKAIEITKSKMLKEHAHVSDAILDVEHGGPFRVWHPEEQGVNVHTLELRLGEIPGKSSPDSTPPSPGKATPEEVKEVKQTLDELVAPWDGPDEFAGDNARIRGGLRTGEGEPEDIAPWEGPDQFKDIRSTLRDSADPMAPRPGRSTYERRPLTNKEGGFFTHRISAAKLKDVTDRLVKPKPDVKSKFKELTHGLKLNAEQKRAAQAFLDDDFDLPDIIFDDLSKGAMKHAMGYTGGTGSSFVVVDRHKMRRYVKENGVYFNGGNKWGFAPDSPNEAVLQAIWHEIAHTVIPQGKLSMPQWENLVDAYAYRKVFGPPSGKGKIAEIRTAQPNPLVSSIQGITSKRGRTLVRDLYDELKRTGEFKGNLADFRKEIDSLRRSGQIKMSAHTDKLPEQVPEVKRNLTQKGSKELGPDQDAQKLKADRLKADKERSDFRDERRKLNAQLKAVKENLEKRGKKTSKNLEERQTELRYLDKKITELDEQVTRLDEQLKSVNTSRTVTKETPELEEGNWASEFRRDLGHENTTLRNRIIDSEFVVKPRTKYTSPVRAHYVEPSSATPDASSKLAKTPRAKAIYEPATVENEEQLLTALVGLQSQIAKTPHSSLYDRITKYVNSIERRLVSGVDPGIDNRKFDTDLLGSPYSTKEFKSSSETVEKRSLSRPASQRPMVELKNSPDYVVQKIKQSWDFARNIKVIDDIEKLAAEGKTAQQTANALGKRLDPVLDLAKANGDTIGKDGASNKASFVREIRTGLGIPSQDQKTEYAAWLKGYKTRAKQPGFTTVGRDESPLQLSTKAPDADFVGRDYSGTAAPKPWQKRTSPDQVERFRGLEKDVNEYLAALVKNKKVPVSVKVGTPQASLFKSRKAAAYYATNVYGIDPKRFRIGQQGNGYFIRIPKIVDETYSAVRDLAIVNNRQSEEGVEGFLKAALGYIITPDEYLSKQTVQNRKVATYGPSEMHRYVEEMAPTLIGLRGQERDELTDMLQAHRDYKYEETTPSGRQKIRRGKFSKTLGAFEQEFHSRFGKVPSEKQTTAYFEGVILHDADLGMRDLALVRDVGRLGLEKTTIGWHVPDPEVPNATQRRQSRPFAARPMDKLPMDDPDGENWGVWVYDPHAKSGNFYLRSELTKDVLDDIDVKTGTHGYKILELGNPLEKPLIQAAGTDELVNFIVVKDYRALKYDWNNIPKRPGGHISYQDTNSVSQAVIRKSDRDGKIRHVYEGDSIMLNVTTEAQAKKLAKAIDDARLLLKDNRMDDLKRHLEANTPFDEDQFKAFFKERVDPETGDITPPKHSLDHPFTYTTGGRNTMDMSHFKEYGRGLENFVDAIRSKYNLFANNVDKKYLGERHPDVPSVFEWRNKDDQPAFTLTAPRLIDPYESINSALANVSRSKYFNDLKIQAAENFIEQFHPVMSKPLEEMRRNPVFYLHNPGWDTTTENFSLLALGYNTRQAHLNLIGSESTLGKALSFAYQKSLNGLYQTRGWGQPAADNVSELLRNAKNPVDFVRGAVFYLKLGMFNPVQYWRQGVAVFHVGALTGSPTRARDAWLRAWAARKLALTDDPKMIEGVADLFGERTAKLGNFDRARFKEAYQELRATGFYNVGGEYASRDDLFDPKVTKGRAGDFLDKSTFFFKEGERFPRMMAWFTAYDEWRATNPTKTMMNADRAWVLDRADLLTTNMSRASNANIQNGSASIPTQFWSYPLRLAEQLLGTRLTKGERARLLLTNMALWGVPVGIGAATVIPFYDDIRQALLEQGVDLKDPAIQVLHDGIISTALSVITGEEYTVGKSYGPGGIMALKEVLSSESSVLEFLGGAAGSVVGDMIKGSDIAYDYLMNWMDPDHTPPTAADLIDFTKNVSSVSNAIRAYYMYTTGTYLTNNEISVLGESSGTDYSTTGTDAFMQLAFGLSPSGVDNTYAMLKSNKERREAISAAEKEAQKNIKRAIQAEAQGDYTTGDIYRRKAKAALVHVPQDRWPGVIRGAAEDNIPLLERVLQDFIKAAPDAETQSLRQERGYEMMGVNE